MGDIKVPSVVDMVPLARQDIRLCEVRHPQSIIRVNRRDNRIREENEIEVAIQLLKNKAMQ